MLIACLFSHIRMHNILAFWNCGNSFLLMLFVCGFYDQGFLLCSCRFVLIFFFSLRPIDVQFMLRLHSKVNIVPVVAKADTLTQLELQKIKTRVGIICFC